MQIITHNKLNLRNTEEIFSCILIYTVPFITQVPWGHYKVKTRHQYRRVFACFTDPTNLNLPTCCPHPQVTKNTGKIVKNHGPTYCEILNSVSSWISGYGLDLKHPSNVQVLKAGPV